MTLFIKSIQQKFRTCYQVLTNRYHICFVYSKPVSNGSRIEVCGWFSKYHRDNELIDDVLNCIDKQDYLKEDRG